MLSHSRMLCGCVLAVIAAVVLLVMTSVPHDKSAEEWLFDEEGRKQDLLKLLEVPTAPPSRKMRQEMKEEDSLQSAAGKARQDGPAKSPELVGFWGDEDHNACCRGIRKLYEVQNSLRSDIMQLLPILHAYEREPDVRTIVEMGSRFGLSTLSMVHASRYDLSKRFATVDLHIRESVQTIFECEKLCLGQKYPDREFFTMEGNNLLMAIPFVADENRTSSQSIDFLFLDTIHNGDQLEMELRRFPQHVRKWIAFHDIISFRDRDEAPEVDAAGHVGPRPKGLQEALRKFLQEHDQEWVEELYAINNNGLLVLRRRSVEIADFSTPYAGKIDIEDHSEVRKVFPSGARDVHGTARNECYAQFNEMMMAISVARSVHDDPCYETQHFVPVTPVSNAFHEIIVQEERIPVGQYLPFIHTQVLVAVRLGGIQKVLFWGCDLAPFIGVLHGAHHALESNMKPDSVAVLFDDGGENASRGCDVVNELTQHAFRETFSSQHKSAYSIVVASAQYAVSRFATLRDVARYARHRIILYGTSLVNCALMHHVLIEEGFELKTMLKASVGVALWERKSSADLHYLPEFKERRM